MTPDSCLSVCRVDLWELHPGSGEWGQRWAEERGFKEVLLPVAIFRAQGLSLPARPMTGDHIHHDGDDYLVKRVTWTYEVGSGEYRCVVHASYNGAAGV